MPVPDLLHLNPSNGQWVELFGLQDKGTKTYFTAGAVVTGTLFDSQDNVIPGFQNLVGVYQTSTNGQFNIFVPKTVIPAPGGGYVLYVVADQGAAHGEWNISTEVSLRKK